MSTQQFMMSNPDQKRRRVRLLLYALGSFLFFYYLIPLFVFNLSPFMISLACSIILFVLSAMVMHSFTFMHNERFDLPVIPIVVYLCLFAACGVLVYFLLERFEFRKAEELDKHGVVAVGEVVDHDQLVVKRSERYFVMIKYRVGDWVHWVEEEVNPEVLSRCPVGNKVKIRYSKNHPRIVQITSCNN